MSLSGTGQLRLWARNKRKAYRMQENLHTGKNPIWLFVAPVVIIGVLIGAPVFFRTVVFVGKAARELSVIRDSFSIIIAKGGDDVRHPRSDPRRALEALGDASGGAKWGCHQEVA